jgi:hypothetical protein
MRNFIDWIRNSSRQDDRGAFRLIIATYLLGQMMDTPAHGANGSESKMLKVQAAFDYADRILNF